MQFSIILSLWILLVNLPSFAAENQDLTALASNPSWTKLFHHGTIKQNSFYASGSANSSAAVELEANLEKLKNDDHYPCDFPARANFLSAHLGLPYSECPAVRKWKETVFGDIVSLVYVSQYVSNPASAFGHTFLLFRSKTKPLNLNSVLSNSAHLPNDVTDFDYIMKGLVGGFPAEFSTDSFYVKLQDYSHIENRDIWIYDLRFSPEQIDQLLNHVWELSHRSTTAYMFLNKNCAAYTYNALAAVHPDLELISPNVYLLPVETVIRLAPLATRVEYIPSVREQMHLGIDQLNRGERDELKLLLRTHDEMPKTQNPKIADLVLEDFEFLRTKQAGVLTEEQSHRYQQALINRAELGRSAESPRWQTPSPPDQALGPRRLSAFGGIENHRAVYGISFAPFYHSLLERSAGYLPFSELIILDTRVQPTPEEWSLDLSLFRAANFPSVTIFDSPWSWRLTSDLFGSTKCPQCLDVGGEISIGKTWEPNLRNRIFILFGVLRDRNLQLAPQILAGGLSDTPLGNGLYQIRTVESLKDPKTLARFELGFNFRLGSQTNLEFLAALDETSSTMSGSVDVHF